MKRRLAWDEPHHADGYEHGAPFLDGLVCGVAALGQVLFGGCHRATMTGWLSTHGIDLRCLVVLLSGSLQRGQSASRRSGLPRQRNATAQRVHLP